MKELRQYTDYLSYSRIRLQFFVPNPSLRMLLRRPVNLGHDHFKKTIKRSIRPGFKLRIAGLKSRIPEGFPN